MTIKAASDDAFRRLIGRTVAFYKDALFNPHWGEQIAFRPDNVLEIQMVFQGLDQERRRRPSGARSSTGWLLRPPISALVSAPMILAVPARNFWDPDFLTAGTRHRPSRRPSGRAGRQCLLGRQSRRGRTGPCMPTNPPGFPRRFSRSEARTGDLVDALFSRLPASAGIAAHQQGPRRSARGGRLPRHGTRR